jgi:hypothetical protein
MIDLVLHSDCVCGIEVAFVTLIKSEKCKYD